MKLIESLESRTLFADVSWNIAFSDGTGVSQPFRTQLAQFIELSGNEWLALAPTTDRPAGSATTELRVSVIIDSAQSGAAVGSAGRLSARSINTTETVKNTSKLFDQTALARVRYADAGLPGSADIELRIDADYLTNFLWFDPDPTARTATVETGKVDAYSAILHEMGHVFFFNGFFDAVDYTALEGDFRSTFDANLTFTPTSGTTQPFFTGANAVTAYGGPVPLTRQNLYHFGNADDTGTSLLNNLMNGSEFNFGQRYAIGPVERAVAADLIVSGTRPAVVDPDPDPDPVSRTITFTGTTQIAYAAANGTQVLVSLKGAGSGQLTFAAGATDNADPQTFQVIGTNSKSVLTITTGAGPAVTIPSGLTLSSALGTLAAGGVRFAGTVSIPGVSILTIGGTTGGTFSVGTAVKSTTFTLGTLSDTAVTIPAAKTVSVAAYLSPGKTLTLGTTSNLTLPGTLSGTLQINGNLTKTTLGTISSGALGVLGKAGALTINGPVDNASIVATSYSSLLLKSSLNNTTLSSTATLPKLTVSGALTGSVLIAPTFSNIAVTGAITSTTVSASGAITKLTANGALTNSVLRAGLTLGTISVASATGSRLAAGLDAGSIPSTLPTSGITFTSPKAVLKNFTTRNGPFSSTLLIAPTITTVSLGALTPNNAGTAFGLYADNFTSLKATSPNTPPVALKKSKGPFTYTDADFRVTVV